jgi:hypothetical protein
VISATRRPRVTATAPPPFRLALALRIVLFCVALPSVIWAGQNAVPQFLYSIPIPEEHQTVLEDVSEGGLILLNATGDAYSDLSDFRRPRLVLWDSGSRRRAAEIPLAECIKRRRAIGTVSQRGRLGPFRFVGDGTLIVGIQNPWLFLIDIRTKTEVFQRLPSLPPAASAAVTGTRRPVLAVGPRRRRVAVVLNDASRPHLSVYQADLRGQVMSWQLATSVQDVSWSPDGNELAVLYAGVRDLHGNYISHGSGRPSVRTLPNIAIFDARTSKRLLELNAGEAVAELEFSRNGKDIYTIPAGLCPACKDVKRDAIRAFSATNGRLEKTFRVPGSGVRDSLDLSPNGRLIAANASSAWTLLGFMAEGSWTRSDGRFVLMDAHDGRIVFKHQERMWNRGAPFKFAFSPSGGLLFADPDCNLVCPGGEVVQVYSVGGTH